MGVCDAKHPSLRVGVLMVLVAGLAGCSGKSGDDDDDGGDDSGQGGFGPGGGDVSVLLIWDNSPSMEGEASALWKGLPALETALEGRDAVIGVTTVSVDPNSGETADIDPGEAGLLVGDPVSTGDARWLDDLGIQLMCEAVYWDESALPSDVSFECSSETLAPGATETISRELLDCLCGFGDWDAASGSGDEEPLEAGLLATCRGLSDPPEVCVDPVSPFDASDAGSNEGLLGAHEDHPLHIIVLSDEGDNSRRLSQGETEPGVYADAFGAMPIPVTWSAMMPDWDASAGEMLCADTAVPSWSVGRVQTLVAQTGGVFAGIAVDDGDGTCVPGDLGAFFTAWGASL